MMSCHVSPLWKESHRKNPQNPRRWPSFQPKSRPKGQSHPSSVHPVSIRDPWSQQRRRSETSDNTKELRTLWQPSATTFVSNYNSRLYPPINFKDAGRDSLEFNSTLTVIKQTKKRNGHKSRLQSRCKIRNIFPFCKIFSRLSD